MVRTQYTHKLNPVTIHIRVIGQNIGNIDIGIRFLHDHAVVDLIRHRHRIVIDRRIADVSGRRRAVAHNILHRIVKTRQRTMTRGMLHTVIVCGRGKKDAAIGQQFNPPVGGITHRCDMVYFRQFDLPKIRIKHMGRNIAHVEVKDRVFRRHGGKILANGRMVLHHLNRDGPHTLAALTVFDDAIKDRVIKAVYPHKTVIRSIVDPPIVSGRYGQNR